METPQSILALAGADAAEGLDPTPLGRGAIKRFRAWKPPGTLSVKLRVCQFFKRRVWRGEGAWLAYEPTVIEMADRRTGPLLVKVYR